MGSQRLSATDWTGAPCLIWTSPRYLFHIFLYSFVPTPVCGCRSFGIALVLLPSPLPLTESSPFFFDVRCVPCHQLAGSRYGRTCVRYLTTYSIKSKTCRPSRFTTCA